jgi:hydroxypyruvate reductase
MGASFAGILPPAQADAVEQVLSAALEAADPRVAVRRALQLDEARLRVGEQEIDLAAFARVRVIGVGKAVHAMALGLAEVLGAFLTDGLLIAKHAAPEGDRLRQMRLLQGGHPVPTSESQAGGQALADFLQGSRPDDLVFCLISGGGSALMTLPVEGVSLEDMQELTRLLLASGANIGEMNTLRKHLDRVKGGGLARMAHPARMVTLVLSDVIGSPLDVIASGPTVADRSTVADAQAVLRKYAMEERAPASIRAVLARGAVAETVKPGDPVLEGALHVVVSSNVQAASAALDQARNAGFNGLLLTTFLQGEASQAGTVLASILRQIDASGQPLARPCCLVAGGETTVTLRGNGKGGRNQEMALAAAFLLEDLRNVALLAFGTDGEDGPTDAAGALVTGETVARARDQGLNPLAFLQNNDAYTFFNRSGGLLHTGPTGTNVNDLAFLFAF